MKVLLCLVLVLVTRAENSLTEVQCEGEMEEAGLSRGFPINVAHRLHSLTLEDLRLKIGADKVSITYFSH